MRVRSLLTLVVLLTATASFAGKLGEFKDEKRPRTAADVRAPARIAPFADNNEEHFPWMAIGLGALCILGAIPFWLYSFSDTAQELRKAKAAYVDGLPKGRRKKPLPADEA